MRRLHLRSLTLALACLAKVACSGPSQKAGASSSASARTPPPFTGTVTIERLLAAQGLAAPGERWGPALAKLEAQVGKPARVREDGTRVWVAIEPSRCALLEVARTEEDLVGLVLPAAVTERAGDAEAYRSCMAAAGVDLGPPEDGNAAGPPTGGSVVPLEMFVDLAVKARSKWKGKRVRVLGALLDISSTSMSAGDHKVASESATLAPSAEKRKPAVACALRREERAGVAAPSMVVAEGVVELREATDGSFGYEPALSDCVLAPADPALTGEAAASSKPVTSAARR